MMVEHFLNLFLRVGTQELLFLFGQLLWKDGCAVLDDDPAGTDLREMVFPDLCGVGDGDRDDRAAGLGSHLHTAFLKRQHPAVLAAGPLRKNTDGDTLFYIFYAGQYDLHTGFDIGTVKEQTVKPLHPVTEERCLQHLCFCHISGQIRTLGIGQKNIKIAAVIANVEDRLVFGDILSANIGDVKRP